MGTSERLNAIISNLVSRSKGVVQTCIVTNERGLIVAGTKGEWSINETVAAMVSLMSETAIRINTNLQFNEPQLASVTTGDTKFLVHEFLVRNRRFRIGAILRGTLGRLVFRIGRLRRKKAITIEDLDLEAAVGVVDVLEGR